MDKGGLAEQGGLVRGGAVYSGGVVAETGALTDRPTVSRDRARLSGLLVGWGAVAGLAWSSGMRGFMAQIADAQSQVHWELTFVWLLLPGALVGALLGWAEYLRRLGGRRGWRWLAASPLLFSAVLFSNGSDFSGLLEDGIGGGAIGVPAVGMLGGLAISGRGPLVGRLLCGALALSSIPVWVLTADDISPGLDPSSARGAWMAVYYWTFLAVLALASSIPHRPCLRATHDREVI